MEKVVLTTYRKLYKMSRRVDASVAMRTQLVCCPLQVYDHRRMEWQPFDISQMDWEESRTFLDGLIRRLNNGSPQFIPPLPEEAAQAIEAYKAQCAIFFAEEKKARTTVTAAATATEAETTESEKCKLNDASNSEEASSASTSGNVTGSAGRSSAVPLIVLPYSKLTVALRQIFDVTPFSVSNLANGFAAVKELQYVCDLDDAGRAGLVKLSSHNGDAPSPSPAASPAHDIPRLQRTLEVAPLHNSLINGLSAEQRVSLDRQVRQKQRAASKKKNAPPASMAAATAAAAAGTRAVGGNAFDDAPDFGEELEAAALAEDVPASTEVPAPNTAAAAASSITGTESLPTAAELMEEPKEVQLLLSHPTARGFFRRTVLLMVRHVTHESAAFVLNKPLRNDEGIEMTIEATVRLGRVHSVFRQHLAQHTLMIGGPVMSGSSFDESIFVLHRVPGIPNALPLGSNLWMDGDLDALAAKLEAKEASAEDDVMVLCGFAGWGFDQLKGEVSNGYWVVAAGASENPAVGSFVMSLAHTSIAHLPGQPKADDAPSTTAVAAEHQSSAAATEPESASPASAAPTYQAEVNMTSEERVRAEAQRAADAAASKALPSLKRRRRRNGGTVSKGQRERIETLSWVRAHASLGEPYADMAMNQKAYAKDDDAQE